VFTRSLNTESQKFPQLYGQQRLWRKGDTFLCPGQVLRLAPRVPKHHFLQSIWTSNKPLPQHTHLVPYGFDRGLTSTEKIILWLLPIIWTKRKYLCLGDNLRHVVCVCACVCNLDNGQDPKQIFLITIILNICNQNTVGPLDSFLLCQSFNNDNNQTRFCTFSYTYEMVCDREEIYL
jgi:hypothetical protein